MATSNRKSSKKSRHPQCDKSFDEFSDQRYQFSEEFNITPDNLERSMGDNFERSKKTEIRNLMGNKPGVKPRTDNQRKLMELIDSNTITFAPGPAGTGKSFIAAYAALKMLWDSNNKIDKIVVIKPACEIVGEKLGYLPGTADDKISVYAYSTLNIIDKIIGAEQTESLVNKKFIIPSPLGYIRGCTFENAVVILEEGQNCNKEQMKTFLSRIGDNSKYIVTGDINQSDRFYNHPEDSGLADALTRLQGIDSIVTDFEFDDDDIVRHPIIKSILKQYELYK